MHPTPTTTCPKHYRTAPDCLAALAAGWITVMDLCGHCTARLIAAVDWVTGRDNTWHPDYRARRRRCPVNRRTVRRWLPRATAAAYLAGVSAIAVAGLWLVTAEQSIWSRIHYGEASVAVVACVYLAGSLAVSVLITPGPSPRRTRHPVDTPGQHRLPARRQIIGVALRVWRHRLRMQ